jgi:F-box/leucine-rich repeat protein 2/20
MHQDEHPSKRKNISNENFHMKKQKVSNQSQGSVPGPSSPLADEHSAAGGDEVLPVVLQVQLRRTLHEFVNSATREQLLSALHRVVFERLSPVVDNNFDLLQNQAFLLLRQMFGSGGDFPTNFRHNLQIVFRDSFLSLIEGISLNQLDQSAPGDELKKMAHDSIKRVNRRDRILLGRELQQLGVTEALNETDLPLTSLLNILSYMNVQELLSSVCRVNRAWFKACTHDKLWTKINLMHFISSPPSITDIPYLVKKLRNCTEFRFSGNYGNDFVLENIGLSCQNVRSIELPECHVISDRGLTHISKLEKLQNLNLESCEQITNQGIEVISSSCRDLQNLNLKYCRSVSDSGILTISQGCRLLKRLNLNYLPITNAALEYLGKGCPHLVELSLKYCRNITDSGVSTLANSCHELKSLTLSYCHQITDVALKHLGVGCVQLEQLNVKYCREITDLGLIDLSKGCPELSDLNLNYCESITDEGIYALAKGCQQLKDLKLVYCRKVSDRGIAAISKECHQLSELLLDSCPLITDNALQHLSEGCKVLTKLNLDQCLQISDSGLKFLARCRDLSKLSFCGCQGITDRGIDELISTAMNIAEFKAKAACPKLKQLLLVNCPNISQACLSRISSLGINCT